MHRLELLETIDESVRQAIADGDHKLSQQQLFARADSQLRQLPVAGGSPPTAGLLLRRHHVALRKELCIGGDPRPMPERLEDEVRELTRAVIVAVGVGEGFSVETAVLLALGIRAGGLDQMCSVRAM